MRIAFIILLTYLFTSPAFADNYRQAFDAADSKDWVQAYRAAQATGKNYMRDYVEWRKLRSSNQRDRANEILSFMENHQDWPEMDKLALRAAESLLLEGYNRQQEELWRKVSGIRQELFGYGWVEGSFDTSEQDYIIQAYGRRLNQEMFEARADRLLWDNSVSRATPLLPFTSRNFQATSGARAAYITQSTSADREFRNLSPALQRDDGLLFAKVNYHKNKQQHESAEQTLKSLPAMVDNGEEWWSLWRYYAREALGEGRYRDALAVLAPIREAEHGGQAQLFWLRGWIQLQFLNNPAEAYKDFYLFYNHVGTPISKSRGAFWAGLAAGKNGNADIARNWYVEGATMPTSFYGQLSALQLSPSVDLRLGTNTMSSSSFSALRSQKDLILKLAEYRQNYSVEAFLFNLADKYNHESEVEAVANLAISMGYPHLAVRIGKDHFGKENEWLQAVSHPTPQIPSNLAIEPALALAIARQESEFNPMANSSADARGLMQLLPSTASLVARQQSISHDSSMLYQPEHNMRLGSFYLASLIEKFNGSYPLAIAAYNAGPGRVVQWQQRFGPFPDDLEGQLKWLEQIPFTETRNYVQRVLENLHVYRDLLNDKNPLTKTRMVGYY